MFEKDELGLHLEAKSQEVTMSYGELIEKSIGIFSRWQLLVCLAAFMVNIPLSWLELSIVFLSPEVKYNCSKENRNHSDSKETIISQFHLVCDREWLKNFAQTMLMLGVLCGHVIFGYLSDRFGRRKPLVFGAFIQSVSGICAAFSPWLWFFMLFRFLCAMAAGGALVVAFVFVVEVVGRKHRSTLGILFQIGYYLGHCSLSGMAYLLPDWHNLQLAISIPTIALISYYWILPESPRWLLAANRLEDAVVVLETAAKFNHMPTDDIRRNVTSKLSNTDLKDENILYLFRSSNVRTKTLILWFNWLILGLSYFGIAQYMGAIGGNIYVNELIAGAIQIPGNVVLIYLIKIFGRKKVLVCTYMLCGLPLLCIMLLPNKPIWPTTLLGSLGMMGISVSFAAMFVFAGELFPTVVRNIGMGTAAMFAKFGSMSAPFVLELKHYYIWLPPLIYGLGPLVAAATCLRLPETLNARLPDTIEEAENFGRIVPVNTE